MIYPSPFACLWLHTDEPTHGQDLVGVAQVITVYNMNQMLNTDYQSKNNLNGKPRVSTSFPMFTLG